MTSESRKEYNALKDPLRSVGFTFRGEADTVMMLYYDESSIRMVRGLNGIYQIDGAAEFTHEAVTAFWAAVNACVE